MKATASIKTNLILGLTVLAWAAGLHPSAAKSDPPLEIKEQGVFFVGGQYDNPANPRAGRMFGQMYVRFQIPQRRREQQISGGHDPRRRSAKHEFHRNP